MLTCSVSEDRHKVVPFAGPLIHVVGRVPVVITCPPPVAGATGMGFKNFCATGSRRPRRNGIVRNGCPVSGSLMLLEKIPCRSASVSGKEVLRPTPRIRKP